MREFLGLVGLTSTAAGPLWLASLSAFVITFAVIYSRIRVQRAVHHSG